MTISANATGPREPLPRKRVSIRGALLRMTTMIVATVIALLIGEIGVRILSPQDLTGTWRTYDQFGVFLNQKSHSARHRLGDRVAEYHFNGRGLRELGQGDGDIRVLCVGDSFTFGSLLNDDQTFVYRLREMADREFGAARFTLLNGGHGGWGAADYVRFVEEYGSAFQLTGLIVFISTDDIGRSLRKPKYDLLEDTSLRPLPGNGGRNDGVFKRIANATPVYGWLLEHSHLVQLARNAIVFGNRGAKGAPADRGESAVLTPQSPDINQPARAKAHGRALFRRLKQLTDERSIQLLVLTTGFHRPASPDETESTRAFMEDARQVFAEEGIAFFDCSESLREAVQGDYASIQIVGDGHPNEDGARLISEVNWPAVRAFLEELDRRETVAASNKDALDCR